MLSWYTRTIYDYLVVGAGIIVLMIVLNKVLRRLGVGREAATGYSLILPWINRRYLDIANTYPELRKLPFMRRFLGKGKLSTETP